MIADFGPGDRLDAARCRDRVWLGDDPDDFVRFTVVSGDTELLLNTDGAGSDFVLVATLLDVTGLGVQSLYDADRLC